MVALDSVVFWGNPFSRDERCYEAFTISFLGRNAQYLLGMVRPRNVKRWKTKPSQRKTVPCRTSFEQYPRVWSFCQEEKDSQKQTYPAAPVLAASKDRVGEKEQLQYQLESDSCLPWGPLWGWGGLLWGFLCWGHWWLPPVSVGIALREGEMRACRAMHGTVVGTYCPETEVRTEVWENLCRHRI